MGEAQMLYEVQDSTGAEFDVPLGKDGLVLTVRNAYRAIGSGG